MRFEIHTTDSDGYPKILQGVVEHTDKIISKSKEHFDEFNIDDVKLLDFTQREVKNIGSEFHKFIPNAIKKTI